MIKHSLREIADSTSVFYKFEHTHPVHGRIVAIHDITAKDSGVVAVSVKKRKFDGSVSQVKLFLPDDVLFNAEVKNILG